MAVRLPIIFTNTSVVTAIAGGGGSGGSTGGGGGSGMPSSVKIVSEIQRITSCQEI